GVVNKCEEARRKGTLGASGQLNGPPVEGTVDVLGIEHTLGRLRRMRDRHDDRATDELREGREHAIGDRRAPVLAYEMRPLAAAERADQRGDVGREGGSIIDAVARHLAAWTAEQLAR